MKILTNGIYFNQTDQKETGYYTENPAGKLIHHKYEKPTFWQRTKYFAKYGYEMNLDTKVTSFFYFFPNDNILKFGSMVGDAISVAKDLKKSMVSFKSYEYTLFDNTLLFEKPQTKYILKFQNEYTQFFLDVKSENLERNLERNFKDSVYNFLEWTFL